MGVAITQACVWGGENQDESFRSSSFSYNPLLDGCAQLLGSLIASFQNCAICVMSGFTVSNIGEKQGAKCL